MSEVQSQKTPVKINPKDYLSAETLGITSEEHEQLLIEHDILMREDTVFGSSPLVNFPAHPRNFSMRYWDCGTLRCIWGEIRHRLGIGEIDFDYSSVLGPLFVPWRRGTPKFEEWVCKSGTNLIAAEAIRLFLKGVKKPWEVIYELETGLKVEGT